MRLSWLSLAVFFGRFRDAADCGRHLSRVRPVVLLAAASTDKTWSPRTRGRRGWDRISYCEQVSYWYCIEERRDRVETRMTIVYCIYYYCYCSIVSAVCKSVWNDRDPSKPLSYNNARFTSRSIRAVDSTKFVNVIMYTRINENVCTREPDVRASSCCVVQNNCLTSHIAVYILKYYCVPHGAKFKFIFRLILFRVAGLRNESQRPWVTKSYYYNNVIRDDGCQFVCRLDYCEMISRDNHFVSRTKRSMCS